MNNSFKAGWLQGFFDGDGTVICTPIKGRKDSYRAFVQVVNTDARLIEITISYLGDLGITVKQTQWHVRRGAEHFKPQCRVTIEDTMSLNTFFKKIGFSAPLKQLKLETIIGLKNRVEACRPRSQPAPTKEELQHLYYNKMQTVEQIAHHFGYRALVSIRRLMKRHGLNRRSKSEATRLGWEHRTTH